MNGYIPPVGFFYSVSLLKNGQARTAKVDAGFQEVSGISLKMETQTITEGGENRFAYKVPGRVGFENLVLKRGLVVVSSPLASWVRAHLTNGLNKKIVLQDVKVDLLDAGGDLDKPAPLMSWHFVNAFPVQWQISDLNAKDSSVVVESLTLAYSFFSIIEANPPKYPHDQDG